MRFGFFLLARPRDCAYLQGGAEKGQADPDHTNMKFAPIKSIIDATFFHELSEQKLNNIKLSEQSLGLKGTYSSPLAGDRTPLIKLTRWSLDPQSTHVISS